ncbi:hypothetical protein [Aquimarina litoralis]|uniref:hypothetical protein n=1 Tax=Aquimarina litoralis TaxID=584605 RepID=UPI001C55E511|nr:hypothetical protein [Aquimarina litoralis]MBW1294991.1 hypothetical protein [Aquimarina litoralis]
MNKNIFYGIIRLALTLFIGYRFINSMLHFNIETEVTNPDSLGTKLGLIFIVVLCTLILFYNVIVSIRMLLDKPLQFNSFYWKFIYWILSPPFLLFLVFILKRFFMVTPISIGRTIILTFVILAGLFFIIKDLRKVKRTILD